MSTIPSSIVSDRAEHQVHDGLRDRQVERAEVDRHPLVLLELLGRIELASCERLAGKRERQERDREERASHSGGFPKYETSESTSSTV